MLSPSLAIVLLVISMGLVALVVLAWAVARGLVSDDALAQQASGIFEDDDLAVERPWESPEQTAERAARYGALVQPEPGAFGGAR